MAAAKFLTMNRLAIGNWCANPEPAAGQIPETAASRCALTTWVDFVSLTPGIVDDFIAKTKFTAIAIIDK